MEGCGRGCGCGDACMRMRAGEGTPPRSSTARSKTLLDDMVPPREGSKLAVLGLAGLAAHLEPTTMAGGKLPKYHPRSDVLWSTLCGPALPSLQIASAHCGRLSSPGGSLLLCRAASQVWQSLSRQEHTVCSSGEPGSWGMRSTLRPHSAASASGLPAGCLFSLDMQPWTAAPNTKLPASSWCTIPSPFWPGWPVRTCTCRLAGSGCACLMWCWC